MYKLTTAATITTLLVVPGLSAPVFNAASGFESLERRQYGVYGGFMEPVYAPPPPPPTFYPPAPVMPQPAYAPPMAMSPYSQGMQTYPQAGPQAGGMAQKPSTQGAPHTHDHDHQHQAHHSFGSASELSSRLNPQAGTGHHHIAGDLAMPHHHGQHEHDHLQQHPGSTAGGFNALSGSPQHHGQHPHDPSHHLAQHLGQQQLSGLPGQQQHHHQQPEHQLHPSQHHAAHGGHSGTYPGASPAGDLAYGSHNQAQHAPLSATHSHSHSASHPHSQSHASSPYIRRSLDFMD